MWKILHKLFGWDYINIRYPYASISDRIARVYVDGEGNPYYWFHSTATKISDELNWITWLTCHPGKYFHSDKIEGYSIR